MTPEKFLKVLKNPSQERAKDNIRELLDNDKSYITNISHDDYGGNETTVVIYVKLPHPAKY